MTLWEKYQPQIEKLLRYLSQKHHINEDLRVLMAFASQMVAKWNPGKAHEKWFPTFVAQRGVWSYLDSIRDRSTPHMSLEFVNKSELLREHDAFEKVDWDDTKREILDGLIEFDHHKYAPVIKTIISERIVPMCSGEPYIGIEGIAAKHSIAPQTVSKLMKSDEVNDYLKRFVA